MSNYEDFVIMKTYVILITFGFIQLVFCNHDINITDYESLSVCPINFFRRKRSFSEYTRWRANQETTNEFLVKVLDEDLTTAAQTQQIFAVNIQPVTKGGEKIIIGGAKVPPPTTSQATTPLNDPLKDYTRFVPPLSTAVARDRANLIAPIAPPNQLLPPLLHANGAYAVRNSLRDDSPPASPQFLARTPTLMARQYAPIAPVAFSRRSTIAPLTPPGLNENDQDSQSSFIDPTRTTAYEEIPTPRRSTTELDQFRRYNSFESTSNYDLITRTTYSVPVRTESQFKLSIANDNEVDNELTTERKMFDVGIRKEDGPKRDSEKDSESSYNMMFYNDDDSDISSNKKEDQDLNENYYEKKSIHDDSPDQDPVDTKEMDIDYSENKNVSLIKDLRVYQEEIRPDNITVKMPAPSVMGIPGIEIETSNGLKDTLRDKRRSICSLLTLRQLNFNSPRTLAEITNQLKQWAEESPVAKWVDITQGNFTTMENPIYMMIVDDPASGQIVSAKQTVMIVAGIQGRDHHAVAAAMYVLYQLVERSESHVDLLTKYRFWIIPVFNPDGYDYSMTFPHRREWTKNLRQSWDTCKGRDYCSSCETHGIRCSIQPCYGVNLDRNFEYQWIPADELRAEHPCGGLYAGSRQLSETETRALTRFMHDQHTPLFTFIAFKEGSVLGIMYPYSHTRKKRAYDQIYRQRASRAAAAAYSISNRPYVAGQTSEFLPLYAGGIEDWVDGHLGIDNTYTVMMFRPSDSYNSKLITERVVHEAFAAVDTLLLQSMEPTLPQPVTLARRGRTSSSWYTRPTCLMTLIPIVVLLKS